MKKVKILAMGLAGLMLASCSQEDLLGPAANGDGNVQITVSLPGDLNTRFGEGIANKVLQYTVFDNSETDGATGTPTVSFSGSVNFGTATSTTVSLNLINGKNYTVAFFAQSTLANTAGVYTFNEGVVTVDYSKMTSDGNFADDYDCFAGTTDVDLTTTLTGSLSAQLYRPVAQINWGANDINANTQLGTLYGTDGQFIQTSLTIASPTNTYDILSGETSTVTAEGSEAPKTVTLPMFGIVPAKNTFPGPTAYTYVAMQYVLPASDDAGVYDLTLNVNNQGQGSTQSETINTVVVNSAPVKANYQTNIYGALLSYNASVTVEVKPGFGSNVNNVPLVWDGSKTYPTIPENTTTPIEINAPSDLAGLADMVNGIYTEGVKDPTFAGYTFTLSTDMDMGGNNFPMLGTGTRSSSVVNGNSFKGVFDGNNKTISNLSVTYTGGDKDAVVGFIANLEGENAEVKNVTFENVKIDGGSSEQAGVVGTVTGNATVTNVTVKSGSISSAETAGAIVGRMILTGSISGCKNGTTQGEGATITGSGNVGGIVGAAYYSTTEAYEMTIENCENYGSVITTNKVAGGIVGISCATVTGCTNYGPVTGPSTLGGIVAYQVMNGRVENCTNNVDGIITATGDYAGGIIGRVAYGLGGAYQVSNPIVVSGNNNYANVTSATETGGVIGRWDGVGTCQNNGNYAKSLIATGTSNAYVAGIIANVLSGAVVITENTSTTTKDQMTGVQVALYYNGTPGSGSQDAN